MGLFGLINSRPNLREAFSHSDWAESPESRGLSKAKRCKWGKCDSFGKNQMWVRLSCFTLGTVEGHSSLDVLTDRPHPAPPRPSPRQPPHHPRRTHHRERVEPPRRSVTRRARVAVVIHPRAPRVHPTGNHRAHDYPPIAGDRPTSPRFAPKFFGPNSSMTSSGVAQNNAPNAQPTTTTPTTKPTIGAAVPPKPIASAN